MITITSDHRLEKVFIDICGPFPERVLRKVGRILCTYCHNEHRDWSQYVESAETFLNLAYHETIGASPYQVMFNQPPPQEISSLIEFPPGEKKELTKTEIHNRILHSRTTMQKRRETEEEDHPIPSRG